MLRSGQAKSVTGYQLSFDGQFWFINQQPYELLYFAAWPWWYLTLQCAQTQKICRLRILKKQLSNYDQWQLSLLFQLYRI